MELFDQDFLAGESPLCWLLLLLLLLLLFFEFDLKDIFRSVYRSTSNHLSALLCFCYDRVEKGGKKKTKQNKNLQGNIYAIAYENIYLNGRIRV